jgi:hypothetical protein
MPTILMIHAARVFENRPASFDHHGVGGMVSASGIKGGREVSFLQDG